MVLVIGQLADSNRDLTVDSLVLVIPIMLVLYLMGNVFFRLPGEVLIARWWRFWARRRPRHWRTTKRPVRYAEVNRRVNPLTSVSKSNMGTGSKNVPMARSK